MKIHNEILNEVLGQMPLMLPGHFPEKDKVFKLSILTVWEVILFNQFIYNNLPFHQLFFI